MASVMSEEQFAELGAIEARHAFKYFCFTTHGEV